MHARFQPDTRTVQEVIDFDPAGRFTDNIAAEFFPCPDNVTPGSTQAEDGTWTIYVPPVPVPQPPAPAIIPPLTVGEFLLLFTGTERVAIKTSQNAVVQDWYELLTKFLTVVDIQDATTAHALDFLVNLGLIDTARKATILSGKRP